MRGWRQGARSGREAPGPALGRRSSSYAPCVLRIALLIALCSACSDEPSPAAEALGEEEWPEPLDDGGLVVRWRARDLWGMEHFEIHRDGSTLYWIDRVRSPELRVERTVNADDLTALRERLQELECCTLQSDPVTAFATPLSEGMLEVRLPGLECDVHRVLRRWDDEATVRCDDAVRELHGRIRPRGRPAPEAEDANEDSAAEASAEDQASDEEQADEAVGEVPPG